MNMVWLMHIMEFYPTTKQNKATYNVAEYQKHLMSERSHSQKSAYCMIQLAEKSIAVV